MVEAGMIRKSMVKKILRIGTRKSPLARVQVREILGALKKIAPGVKTRIVAMDTVGDRDKKTPISDMEGTDFFTREIDRALLDHTIDCAVHSAKDLPDRILKGIKVAAITASVDPYDVLVSKKGLKLAELPKGARIGTSSERRKDQIHAYRPDLEIVDIRGTIRERLDKLKTESLDATVIAGAGLVRLGLGRSITEKISLDILKPHPLQGSLAVTVRSGDKGLLKLFSKLNGKKTASYENGLRKGTSAWCQKRILVTGTSIERFKDMGEIVHAPMIEIKPVTDFRSVDAAISRLDSYDVVIFTSKHAVRHFLARLQKKKEDIRNLRGKKIIAIGKTTARELAALGLSAGEMPGDESAHGILKILKGFPVKEKRFLIPRSDLARDLIPDELRERGAHVDTVTVYRNVPSKTRRQDLSRIDEIIFTSPSTVRAFFAKHRKVPGPIRLKAIGLVTQACLQEYGKKAEVLLYD